MAFLHSQSCECVKTELDLFAVPPTQTSIENGQWVNYKPLSSITEDGPIEFVIPGHGEDYLDLSQTMLYLNAKIIKDDNTALLETDNVAPVNNWLHSIFSQVDVYLNQKLISPPNNTYPYISYIETLLNYGKDAKKSHLTSALWYSDDAGKMNNIEANGNIGHNKRKKFTEKSKNVDMIGHLHVDIFNQEKFLLHGVEMKLRLVRSRDSFHLLANDSNYKVEINEATLLVRRVKLNPSILLAHNKALEMSNAKYAITRAEVKAVTIPAGIQGKSLDNIFLGQLPKRCIIGFVTNKAFNGDYKCNPFNFENFKINYLSLCVNGQQIPSKPLQPSFSGRKSYIQMYNTLFSGTGIHFSNSGNEIDRDSYPNGFCLSAFDLTPDLAANSVLHCNLTRHGSLRIEVGFDNALTETVNCVIYAEFDNIIEIDKNRNVIVDYGS